MPPHRAVYPCVTSYYESCYVYPPPSCSILASPCETQKSIMVYSLIPYPVDQQNTDLVSILITITEVSMSFSLSTFFPHPHPSFRIPYQSVTPFRLRLGFVFGKY